jgi:alanyl-tRNA synthetase
MSERLYYDDCYVHEFEAVVVDAGDDRRRILLNRTAFYPTSGGQPFDTGQLNDAKVIEVIDDDRGILHVLDRPLASDQVSGKVDWDRRFDHMQQHTGQHLLSAVFEELYGMKTLSFHLGAEASTIELAIASFTNDQLRSVERRANAIVFEDRAVQVAYEDAQQAQGLRKASDREGTLRIVSIDGLDRSACGGTHVRRTGEIGPILVRKTERIRGNTRVEFFCGFRAVDRARNDYENLALIAQTFSSAADEAPGLVKAMSARVAEAEKARKKLAGELAQARGRELHAATIPDPSGLRRHVEQVQQGPISDELRYEAQSFVSQGKALFLAFTAEPPSILLAASQDSGVHAGDVVKAVAQAEGGRGGGNAQIGQASVPSPAAFQRLKEHLGLPD